MYSSKVSTTGCENNFFFPPSATHTLRYTHAHAYYNVYTCVYVYNVCVYMYIYTRESCIKKLTTVEEWSSTSRRRCNRWLYKNIKINHKNISIRKTVSPQHLFGKIMYMYWLMNQQTVQRQVHFAVKYKSW